MEKVIEIHSELPGPALSRNLPVARADPHHPDCLAGSLRPALPAQTLGPRQPPCWEARVCQQTLRGSLRPTTPRPSQRVCVGGPFARAVPESGGEAPLPRTWLAVWGSPAFVSQGVPRLLSPERGALQGAREECGSRPREDG